MCKRAGRLRWQAYSQGRSGRLAVTGGTDGLIGYLQRGIRTITFWNLGKYAGSSGLHKGKAGTGWTRDGHHVSQALTLQPAAWFKP